MFVVDINEENWCDCILMNLVILMLFFIKEFICCFKIFLLFIVVVLNKDFDKLLINGKRDFFFLFEIWINGIFLFKNLYVFLNLSIVLVFKFFIWCKNFVKFE